MDLYDELVAAGCTIDNHYSDLYVEGTPEAQAILVRHKARSKPFIDNIDGNLWYDVPFAYKPFWDAVQKRAN